ncbi:hypothetical protein H7683_19915 [Ectopseudomonas mendocina]|uniref:hypothetical protein n=1 Tax=Ectopseudomonas mendocina TaxID=300 RepID=UPI001AE0B85C|nr:hypothetical protein [Pseudomonas mendocina]QTN45228.1 hypothetical protein H7683_19915 [Pseudomonas mendocina]
MLSELGAAARWLLSLSGRLIAVVPGLTFCSVIATVVSQSSLLLAFVLPLKVILLLGSVGVPHYFPEQFKAFDRQSLILLLSGSAVLLFLIHVLVERLIGIFVAIGSRKLISRSNKMVLFESQDDIAARAYQRFSRGLASVCILALVFPLLAYLYPGLTLVLLSFVFFVFLLYMSASFFSDAIYLLVYKSLDVFFAVVGGGGFLLCFCYMVFDFLWFASLNVIIAVICLILLRQFFNHAAGALKSFIFLAGQRLQLSALFFHGQMLLPSISKNKVGVWELAQPDTRRRWVETMLFEVLGVRVDHADVEYLQSSLTDIVFFRVSITESGKARVFLVKLFSASRSVLAKHEATLLTMQKGLPALRFLGATILADGIHCHVFALNAACQVSARALGFQRKELLKLLGECPPSAELQALYKRSKPNLWQRMDKDIFYRLRCVSDDHAVIDCFEEVFENIREALSELPLVVVNSDISTGTLFVSKSDKPYMSQWSRWALEPIGSSWPSDSVGLDELASWLPVLKKQRSDLIGTKTAAVQLSALLFSFEQCQRRQDYKGALSMLPRILEKYNAFLGE